MKKTILIILVIVALPLYSYNLFLLLKTAFPIHTKNTSSGHAASQKTFEQLLMAAAPVVFENKGRDPFTLYTVAPKPVAPVKTTVVKEKTVKKAVAAPAITVTGIMWNPDNPVAMLKLPGGKSTLVKVGQQIGGNLTVTKVEKKSVTVVFEGTTFTIDKK